MRGDEKRTFWRFVLIYMSISFLLFVSLALYYYYDQKHLIEDRLSLEMSRYAGIFRESDRSDLPKGFHLRLVSKTRYPYPAFFREKKRYIATSCAGFDYPGKAIVVEADSDVLASRLSHLKRKIVLFMGGAFVINLLISIFLSWLSLRPVREANRRFREFVEEVVHDLNAPVSAITLNAETLGEEIRDPRTDRISRSVETINNLSKNLESLLLERTECHPEIVAVDRLCASIMEQIGSLFPEVCFRNEVPPVILYVDPVALERILYNLIVNAAKYTTQNAVVTVSIEKNRLFVRDNGPGMEDPQKMLGRGRQGSSASNGYGLGLGIVQRLCDACGIGLTITSKRDRGTTFYCDIAPFMTTS